MHWTLREIRSVSKHSVLLRETPDGNLSAELIAGSCLRNSNHRQMIPKIDFWQVWRIEEFYFWHLVSDEWSATTSRQGRDLRPKFGSTSPGHCWAQDVPAHVHITSSPYYLVYILGHVHITSSTYHPIPILRHVHITSFTYHVICILRHLHITSCTCYVIYILRHLHITSSTYYVISVLHHVHRNFASCTNQWLEFPVEI
jgi:hypothetical protein